MATTLQAHAWTTYWRQSAAAAGCLPSAPPQVARALEDYWRSVAEIFPRGARLLDLGCGTGAVAQVIAKANPNVEITGVDFSQVPASRARGIVLMSGVRMESLPFSDHGFDGAVSQFGIEYSDLRATVTEMARVLTPGAPVALAVHHAGSPIIAHNRRRSDALEAVTGEGVRSAFVSGDRGALARALGALAGAHHDQDVLGEFSAGLGQALGLAPVERRQLWTELSSKVAQERVILDALENAAVKNIGEWLTAFDSHFAFEATRAIGENGGVCFAWAVLGKRL